MDQEEDTLDDYVKCLQYVVEEYSIYIDTLVRFIRHFKQGKYPLPLEKQKRHIKQKHMILNITKEPDDPFDTIYNISFVTRMSTFEDIFKTCLKRYDLQYDLNTYLDKQLLLQDFGLTLKEKYHIKPKIFLKGKRIEIQFQFFLTKTDIVIV